MGRTRRRSSSTLKGNNGHVRQIWPMYDEGSDAESGGRFIRYGLNVRPVFFVLVMRSEEVIDLPNQNEEKAQLK